MQPAKASDSLTVFPDNRRRHQPIRLAPVRWQIEPRQSQTFICSEAFSLYLEGWRFAMLLDLLTHIYIHKHRITLANSEIPNHLIGALVTNTQLFTHLWDNLICRASVFPACNLQLLWSVTYTEHLQMKLWLHPKTEKCCLRRHSKVGRHRGTSESKLSFTSCLKPSSDRFLKAA